MIALSSLDELLTNNQGKARHFAQMLHKRLIPIKHWKPSNYTKEEKTSALMERAYALQLKGSKIIPYALLSGKCEKSHRIGLNTEELFQQKCEIIARRYALNVI